jgi:hypothetical protein
MRTNRTMKFAFCIGMTLIFGCGVALPSDTPADVSGTWSVTASDGRRSATQTLVIRQDGNNIAGTFRGPRQSGTLDGKVSGNTITFHVSAKRQLDYTGTVNGDSMLGTLSGSGNTGNWTATRTRK